MAYFKRREVEDAIADLKENKSLPLEQARQNGWSVQVEQRYGLTVWVKDFQSFTLSEDRGGQKGLSQDGNLVCSFYSIHDLERDEWIESQISRVLERP